MTNENDLLQKLMISKKMMDIHNKMPRSGQGIPSNYNIPEVQDFDTPKANYNIPQEFMMEQSRPVSNSEVPTTDRILNSKLPDEIKQLMIEYPIAQPNSMSGPTLSNELVEKATRLMNSNNGQNINEQPVKRQQSNQSTSSLTAKQIKDIVRETVEEVLSENGLLTESTQKSNEVFQFKVGKHIFEGKVTKIKKVQ
jgi:hypothetical protein